MVIPAGVAKDFDPTRKHIDRVYFVTDATASPLSVPLAVSADVCTSFDCFQNSANSANNDAAVRIPAKNRSISIFSFGA